MSRSLLSVAVLIFLQVFVFEAADARTMIGEGIYRRQQQKENTRWTLADWMTQKKQFLTMDHWLAMNRSLDLFELNIEGGKSTYDLEAGVGASLIEHEVETGSISFYWSIFGLQYSFEDSDEGWKRQSGRFNLRLLGASSQTTNLTAFYGVRKWEFDGPPAYDVTNQFAGAALTLYVVSFFGIDGQYEKHFAEKASNNNEYESEKIQYGAFIDVYFVRLYGRAFTETVTVTDTGGNATKDTREGSEAGVKFYF